MLVGVGGWCWDGGRGGNKPETAENEIEIFTLIFKSKTDIFPAQNLDLRFILRSFYWRSIDT